MHASMESTKSAPIEVPAQPMLLTFRQCVVARKRRRGTKRMLSMHCVNMARSAAGHETTSCSQRGQSKSESMSAWHVGTLQWHAHHEAAAAASTCADALECRFIQQMKSNRICRYCVVVHGGCKMHRGPQSGTRVTQAAGCGRRASCRQADAQNTMTVDTVRMQQAMQQSCHRPAVNKSCGHACSTGIRHDCVQGTQARSKQQGR